MAKKESFPTAVDRNEQIRKAKGNPNKNIHAKKAGSNYHGYQAARQQLAEKAAEKPRRNKVRLPKWMAITQGTLFAALVVFFILRFYVLQESEFVANMTYLTTGLVCAILFYTRRYRSAHDPKLIDKVYGIFQVALMVLASIYFAMGVMGFAGILDNLK